MSFFIFYNTKINYSVKMHIYCLISINYEFLLYIFSYFSNAIIGENMSIKIASATNFFVGIIFLFSVVFSLFSLMEFFSIPLPSVLTPALNLSILYCIQPFFILFGDLLGLEIGVVGQYIIYFSNFIFFVFLFIFSIALGVRQMQNQRSKGLTLFVQFLHAVNIISSLLVVISYLVIDYFEPLILVPAIGLFGISLLAFLCNLFAQKKRMIGK